MNDISKALDAALEMADRLKTLIDRDEKCLGLAEARAKWEASGGPKRVAELWKKVEENPWPEGVPEICGEVRRKP